MVTENTDDFSSGDSRDREDSGLRGNDKLMVTENTNDFSSGDPRIREDDESGGMTNSW